MKKFSFAILIFILPLLLLGEVKYPIQSVRVTYLANTSFLIKAGNSKIMFNGLFQSGMNRFSEPDVHTTYLLKNALPPFDDVSLVLVSNHEAHQFDPYLAIQFLLHNAEAKIICPQQALNKMKIFVEDFEQVKSRIIESTPMKNHYDRILVGGLEVVVAQIQAPYRENSVLENLAYLVNIEGVKFFHSGDSAPKLLQQLNGLGLADQQIDLAFLADHYGVGSNAQLTNRIVGARYNVLMQFEKSISDHTLDQFANRSKLNSRPHIFKFRNQAIDFYIHDYIVEPNSLQFLSYSQF